FFPKAPAVEHDEHDGAAERHAKECIPRNHDYQAMSWIEFRRAYPRVIGSVAMVLLGMLAVDAWTVATRRKYASEIVRLRASMSDLERQRTDEIVSHERNKVRLAIALLRRQARLESTPHLSIS